MGSIRGHIPIIVVGGTGFYIQALLYDISFEDNEEDHSYGKSWKNWHRRRSAEKLHQMLQQVDKKRRLGSPHTNNMKRVIRAWNSIIRPVKRFPNTMPKKSRKEKICL